jgi:hypothetical protein
MRVVVAALIGTLLPLALGAPDSLPLSSEALRIAKIQQHFDGALEMLASRGLTPLSAAQRANRARLVDVLTEYRDAGAYPRNYDFPDAPTPYFVDRKTGILCAVANLMAATGHRELVDRVAAADNNVWVAELADDTEFRAWLDEQGLTLAEAARIQIPYEGETDFGLAPVRSGFPVVAMTAVAASTSLALINLTVNRDGDRRWLTRAGLATGVVAVGAGFLAARGDGDARFSAGAISLGAAGLLSSSRAATRYRSRASVSPIIPIGPQQGAGLSLQLTF